MTIKDVTVRFEDGVGVRLRGETLLDPDEGTYVVLGSEPGTKVVFNFDNITYLAESAYDPAEATPSSAQEQGRQDGLFL